MNENNNEKYIHQEHKEIMVTIVYTIVLVFLMWGASLILN